MDLVEGNSIRREVKKQSFWVRLLFQIKKFKCPVEMANQT